MKNVNLQRDNQSIQAILNLAESEPKQNWVIICHPHPLYGGTMQNKVVTTLEKTYKALGFSTLRFNFRGVGQSTGVHDNGVGEAQDLLYLISWAKGQGALNIHLAGFSFGGYVAAQGAMQAASIKSLVTVAPMVSRFQGEEVHIRCPWMLVASKADEVIHYDEVQIWLRTLDPQPQVIVFEDASHFFHGKLLELQSRLTQEFLKLI